MEKKYQVFVSSTYQDLIEERQRVIEGIIGQKLFSCWNGVFSCG